MKKLVLLTVLIMLGNACTAWGATVYSNKYSYMGPGLFYGPGHIDDVLLFDVTIRNVGFAFPLNFVTPFVNNGAAEPNVCAEHEMGRTPTGMLSDGVTRINENVDTCAFEINGTQILAAIIDGGPHQGQQISVVFEDGEMIMTMDFALDLGIGKGGIIKLPFYGTTGTVVLPPSLQTQMGIEGGVDQAGSLKAGDTLTGRLGDYNGDGMLDGAIVVAGNMPLDAILLPGAPYALIRYFETDIPYLGKRFGRLARLTDEAPDGPGRSLRPRPGTLGQRAPQPLTVPSDRPDLPPAPPRRAAWASPSREGGPNAPAEPPAVDAAPQPGPGLRVDLWSEKESYLGPGRFVGPGAVEAEQELFEARIHNMLVVTAVDLVTPFVNNGAVEPNTRGEEAFGGSVDGRLSDGTLINENVDLGLMTLGGQPVLPAVVRGKLLQGQQLFVRAPDGTFSLSMDLAFDFGAAGVVRLPFYGTTGEQVVPASLQTQAGQAGGVDRAGALASGTVVQGRLGDFNEDGWIDGTLVATGTMPLASPRFAGQPYVVYRHFEISLPAEGVLFGKTFRHHPQGMQTPAHPDRPKRNE